MIAPPMLPAIIVALSGLVLLAFYIITNTTWVNATDEQKVRVQKGQKWVLGIFAIATVVNLFYQFSPDPTKKTVIQSASTLV